VSDVAPGPLVFLCVCISLGDAPLSGALVKFYVSVGEERRVNS
jgi:hypothetical protein